ncbi:Arginine biosynthesis bifunctional protein ArgJ [Posidoniimonas polymericola]|uniref:Arginine biosynthesis bifunctional protein ArgJ n=1 Tax=Posidoniimonas polymericola TaxID=2528002 RepID=A0A5C5YQ71_9BACT|nr:bifunctional glutamate N-acetyltransferase/amino-acid acetyltransferase ArgJ [Posidoniimonas polymericola]TWT76938.1 Arginine biosynthesis bifunctional protein ArgJ [Posidoniimonas polymericola]
MDYQFPKGFQGSGLHCGIKRNAQAEDLALIVSDRPAVGVGVYTRNLVCAAPVQLDRQRTPGDAFRGVVINSGNANACTGERGMADAKQMADWFGEACGFPGEQALVLSTGIIGEHLPLAKIKQGITDVSKQLGSGADSLTLAARGMMTTDTVPKIRGRSFELDGVPVSVVGLAKGAAMIGPSMATMLGVIMTDAAIRPEDAHPALSEAVDESFNCISVDGHTSTNDTVLLLANGAAGGPVVEGKSLSILRATILEVCEDLAQSIPADGEGATHLVTVEVHGCKSRKDAVQIAKTIADSPLVKTAIAGADPNWGRIVSAAGYAGIPFEPESVTLLINGLLVYEHGVPVKFDAEEVSASIRDNRDTGLVLILSEGAESARFWTTDLTAEYVRLNADYHT